MGRFGAKLPRDGCICGAKLALRGDICGAKSPLRGRFGAKLPREGVDLRQSDPLKVYLGNVTP